MLCNAAFFINPPGQRAPCPLMFPPFSAFRLEGLFTCHVHRSADQQLSDWWASGYLLGRLTHLTRSQRQRHALPCLCTIFWCFLTRRSNVFGGENALSREFFTGCSGFWYANRSAWSMPKVLYIFSRYYPLFHLWYVLHILDFMAAYHVNFPLIKCNCRMWVGLRISKT